MHSKNSDTIITQELEKIAKEFRGGHCRFFIGAAVPEKEARLPGVSELTLDILEELSRRAHYDWVRPLLSDSQITIPLSAASQLYQNVHNGSRTELLTLLERKLDKCDPIGGSYKALRSLANFSGVNTSKTPLGHEDRRVLPYVYTTNYDYSIEQAIGQEKCKTLSFRNASDFRERDPTKRPAVWVIHLHGDLQDSELVITEDDELRQLTDEKRRHMLHELLEQDYMRKTLIFVGYSLGDANVTYLSYFIRDLLGTDPSDDRQDCHYVVRPMLSEDSSPRSRIGKAQMVKWTVDKEIWSSRKVTFLNLSAAEFFTRLNDIVTAWSSRELAGEIADRLTKETGERVSQEDVLKRAAKYQDRFQMPSVEATLRLLRAGQL